MSSSVEEARIAWLAERTSFEAFALYLRNRLEGIMRGAGVYAEVHARAKEVHSLVKKLILKQHLTYQTIPDKVGVRVTVRYRSDLPKALTAITEAFAFASIDDKTDKLELDKVGYQSTHIDGLVLKAQDSDHLNYPSDRFYAELQLRTQAQHLWSEFTHDTVYKNDATLIKMPSDLLRRVNLMAGLIEVADRELDRIVVSEIPTDVAVTVLRNLEGIYYELCSRKPDVDLSLEVIRLLLPLYAMTGNTNEVSTRISRTYEARKETLKYVYAEAGNNLSSASAFLFQPEALMIYDRLLADRDKTLLIWSQRFPPEELERIASLFGLSLY